MPPAAMKRTIRKRSATIWPSLKVRACAEGMELAGVPCVSCGNVDNELAAIIAWPTNGPDPARLRDPDGLPEERAKRPLVDLRQVAHFDVPHVLRLAVEQPLRVLQRRSSEEAELHVIGGGVHVGDRPAL